MNHFNQVCCIVPYARRLALSISLAALCLGPLGEVDAQNDVPKPVPPSAVQDPSAPANQTAQQQRNEQTIKQLTERAFAAIDQLVPGEFPENSELAAALRSAAETTVRGNLDQAREQLNKLLEANPQLPPAGLLLAGIFFALNQNDAGHVELEKAAVDHPDYPGIYTAFARLAITQTRWTDALAEVRELRTKIDAGQWTEDQKNQFEMEYCDAMVDALIGRQQYEAARPFLAELQTLLPDNANVLIRQAEVDYRQDKIDSAIQFLAQAGAKDTNLYVPELVLYQWKLNDGQPEDAQKWLTRAAEKYPNDKNVQFEYGKYLLEAGNANEAAVWIDKADQNGANPVLVRFVRGQISYYRGAFQIAEADFRELNSQRPNDFGTKNMLALSMIESTDGAKRQSALEIATFNLQSNPNNVFAASTLGWILYRLGRVSEASQLLARVLASPNVPTDSAYYVAHLFADEGQYERAIALLNQSLEAKGLFLNRERATEFLKDVQSRLKATGGDESKAGEGGGDKQ